MMNGRPGNEDINNVGSYVPKTKFLPMFGLAALAFRCSTY